MDIPLKATDNFLDTWDAGTMDPEAFAAMLEACIAELEAALPLVTQEFEAALAET